MVCLPWPEHSCTLLCLNVTSAREHSDTDELAAECSNYSMMDGSNNHLRMIVLLTVPEMCRVHQCLGRKRIIGSSYNIQSKSQLDMDMLVSSNALCRERRPLTGQHILQLTQVRGRTSCKPKPQLQQHLWRGTFFQIFPFVARDLGCR
jgi:hypothetical protein